MEHARLQPDRRTFLRAAALGGVVLAFATSGCGSTPSPVRQTRVEAYLPTSLSEEEYDAIGSTLGTSIRRIGRIPLAFANLDPHAPGVQEPALSPGLRRVIQSSDQYADLSLVIGGGTVMPVLWELAASDPTRFGKSANRIRHSIEETLQRPVHATVDCESDLSIGRLKQIIQALRNELPSDRDLAVTVPVASDNISTMAADLKSVAQQVQMMAYDQYGHWSKVSGPVTSWPWISSGVTQWRAALGDGRRLQVGYPTYGYEFVGAQKMGQAFRSAHSVLYTQIPPGAISDDPNLLTSVAALGGNVVSCVSPDMIKRIAERVLQACPDIGGAFFWSMNGLTPEHLNAVDV